jgi:hypothetical protein
LGCEPGNFWNGWGGDIKITTLVNFHLYFISSISSMDECFMLKKGDKLDVGETLIGKGPHTSKFAKFGMKSMT